MGKDGQYQLFQGFRRDVAALTPVSTQMPAPSNEFARAMLIVRFDRMPPPMHGAVPAGTGGTWNLT